LFTTTQRNKIVVAETGGYMRSATPVRFRSTQKTSRTVLLVTRRGGFAIEASGNRNRIGPAFSRKTASRAIDMVPNIASSEKTTRTNPLGDVMRRSWLLGRIARRDRDRSDSVSQREEPRRPSIANASFNDMSVDCKIVPQ
jgi:hypothetical protein